MISKTFLSMAILCSPLALEGCTNEHLRQELHRQALHVVCYESTDPDECSDGVPGTGDPWDKPNMNERDLKVLSDEELYKRAEEQRKRHRNET